MNQLLKRTFDVLASAVGLLLLSPVMLLTALVVKMSSPGPVFFRQERVGRHFRPFQIYKFRTMVVGAPQQGGAITAGDADPRITRLGRWLRRTKLDELMQLVNVLRGEMSIVGPRPEVPRYVAMFRKDYEEILQVRPGITDFASLKYRDEAALLSCDDPESIYVREILPDKIRLAKDYVARASLPIDLWLIIRTLLAL